MERDWEAFLAPYEQTVSELKVKLRGIRKQFREQNRHVPIEFVTGRVKPVDSIVTKSQLRHIPMGRLEEEMSDIAGLRIMCQFVEDIHQVVEIIRKRKDMKVLQERDYITNKKASGYRSYHLVIEYPVQLISGEKKILAEIQIRTLAMNFWATIEQLDEEMSSIREEIQEAQRLFSHGRGKSDDVYYRTLLKKESEREEAGDESSDRS